jgi:hypothetical protein
MFPKELINKILEGKKTMTSRDKILCKEGKITNLMANRDYSKITRKYIRITKVYPKRLGDFNDKDGKKEGFNNLEEFKNYWKHEKKLGKWDDNRIVWVHEFELIEL